MDRPITYGEVDGFITMLLVAREDSTVNSTLSMLLAQAPEIRRRSIRELLARFRWAGAPRSLQDAFACLLDDRVAQQARETITR